MCSIETQLCTEMYMIIIHDTMEFLTLPKPIGQMAEILC